MKTDDFDYYLPEELIAQTPLEKRDSSKLLVLDKDNLFIPEDKWYISNEIIVKLLEGEKYE